MSTNIDMFSKPVYSRKVRNGVWAHKYNNGVVNIMGEKYLMYTMSDAIKLYRQQFPVR